MASFEYVLSKISNVVAYYPLSQFSNRVKQIPTITDFYGDYNPGSATGIGFGDGVYDRDVVSCDGSSTNVMLPAALAGTGLDNAGVIFFAGWVYLPDAPANGAIETILNINGPGLVYRLNIQETATVPVYQVLCVPDGNSRNAEFFIVVTGEWVFLQAYADVAGDEIGMRINKGAWNTAAASWSETQTNWSNPSTGNEPTFFCRRANSSNDRFFTGRACHLFLATSIPSDAELNALHDASADFGMGYGENTASVTLTGFPASASGITVDVSVDRDGLPFYSAAGQSANGSGELAIAATGCPLAAGTRTVWIRCTNSDGNAGGLSNNSRAFYSPVEVTVS